MRVGLLFHKDPTGPPVGIDLIRLRALCAGLDGHNTSVEVVAPVRRETRLPAGTRVVPLEALDEPGRYDVLKACYHFSLPLLGRYDGPLVCRLVRVVDERLPLRDRDRRPDLLACQAMARERAIGMVFNNEENAQRWVTRYGRGQRIVLLPSGCPAELPQPGPSPFQGDLPVLLFLGSLAAPGMTGMLNDLAERLNGRMAVHFVGRDKSPNYGGPGQPLSPLVVRRGEVPEPAVWDLIRHARVGLALCVGPDLFDNDLSKIVSYLRAGLPVLCEEGVLNAGMAVAAGMGLRFRRGDAGDAADKALALLPGPAPGRRAAAMDLMVRGHSWDVRAEALERFLAAAAGLPRHAALTPPAPGGPGNGTG